MSELAVYLDIAKLVLEEDDDVVLWKLWEEGENDRGLASPEEACKDGDRDGHEIELPNMALHSNHTMAISAATIARLHTVFAASAFLFALAIGSALHFHKIVKNDVAQFPDEWFPSVSATYVHLLPVPAFPPHIPAELATGIQSETSFRSS